MTRPIKCSHCGSPVILDDTIIENLEDELEELMQRLRHIHDPSRRHHIEQEAAHIRKAIKGIRHRTTEIELRKTSSACELSEIITYVRTHSLIDEGILNELKDRGKEKAKRLTEQDQAELARIYGELPSRLTNRSKADPTAQKALNHITTKK